jgi:transcriptional regulator with PAS, ATPase and Fis domain
MANNGTLFLDEIGDMPLELQAVLLRVLEDKYVVRIGGSEMRPVDFRLVAATNQNLEKLVDEHLFRADLFFRLSTLKIDIPPLRERGNDILLFATHFLTEYCIKMGWSRPKISEAAAHALTRYSWPGNVRQLEKVMIYAASTAKGGIIDVEHLPKEILPAEEKNRPVVQNYGQQLNLRRLEIEAIQDALLETAYHVEEAAELLGIGRSTLYKRLKRYKISIPLAYNNGK